MFDYHHISAVPPLIQEDTIEIDTPLTRRAHDICLKAHQHQVDKAGEPYHLHPCHLASQMHSEASICVAYLHDVIEDTSYTINDLKEAQMTDEILDALSLMTHDSHIPYMEYVMAIRTNPVARRVKIADLTHNSDLRRIPHVTDRDLARVRKYAIAKALLSDDSLIDGHYVKKLPLNDHDAIKIYYQSDGSITHYEIYINKTVLMLSADEFATLRQYTSSQKSIFEWLSDQSVSDPLFLIEQLSQPINKL